MLFGAALHSDLLRSGTSFAFRFSNTSGVRNPGLRPDPRPDSFRILRVSGRGPGSGSSSSNGAAVEKSKDNRFSICTADELHFVKAPNSDWSLALWRYLPSPQPQNSFARYMSGHGFDTWVLEVRGAGLSTLGLDLHRDNHPLINISENVTSSSVNHAQNGVSPPRQYSTANLRAFADSDISLVSRKRTHLVLYQPQFMTKLRKAFMPLSQRLSNKLNEGVLEAGQNSVIASQITELNQWLVDIIKESQRLFPVQFFNLRENFSTTLGDLQQQFELIFKYDWDFDNFVEEDVPAVMEYIRTHCKLKDGKLHAIGHSMGGILLYAMLSRSCFEGNDSGFASITTLASSLDYTSSRSSLKLLLPLADPAQALNVPAIPVGAIISAIHPLASRPPYVLSWLKSQISSQEMMQQQLYEKLVLNNFCTIPAKLLLQLTSAFQKGGLRDRRGTFFYKDHLHKTNVPILAIGGDQDLICPPEAVYETAKLIPENMLTLKFLGEPGGPHYAHYDLVGSQLAADQVFPHIIEFLSHHDMT
ncbi:alpha/beta hydrolase family protein [Parasponia andersonii]|uniref:Alpha/beta hydrolase family protein n=1 Tax=Parasponia andersonii TaxID=3476 RepID=A0A2P5AQW4_PARAD|nr:alpha/beta hydrolase family protein [Parasponia andersonii]